MEVIYYCYAGAHTSITAASIHLGLLPVDRVPEVREILALPNFDQTPSQELGKVFKYGVDENGNNVYVAALGPGRTTTMGALKFVLKERGLAEDALVIVNGLECISLTVRIGGFISRRLGLVRVGRPMCAWGILAKYNCFLQMAQRIRALIGH